MRRGALLLTMLVACADKPAPAGTTPDAGADAGTDAGGEPPLTLITLAPGEVAEVTVGADGVAAARLATPAGSEQFVAVLASTRIDTGAPVHGYGIATDPVAEPTGGRMVTGCALGDDPWKTTAIAAETAPSGAGPAVGATRTLRVGGETIDAKVVATSSRAVVWMDVTAAHPATVEPSFVDSVLADFDATILPRARQVFGVESDLDGDGRVGLVFTPLTASSAVAFFNGCDLVAQQGCPEGNRGEYLYLTPPANIDPPYNTPAAVKEIVAHELGHLVHFNRKVLKNGLTDWPDSAYMIEGFGAFSQDVLGYQAGNLYVTQAGLTQLDQFSVADVLGARTRYDAARDGLLRGGAYLLVRWIYDRGGSDVAKPDGTLESRGGPALLRALFDGPKAVSAALLDHGASSLGDVTMDFYTTLALSNGETKGFAKAANACFAFRPVATDPVTQKPRGADVRASFHGMEMPGAPVQAAAKADRKLRAGGAEYLSVGATAGAPEMGLTISVDPAAAARLRVARVK